MKKLIITLASVLALAACGSSTNSTTSPAPVPEQSSQVARYTEAQVARTLGLSPTSGGWQLGERCDVVVIMTNAAQVQTYAFARDPVASNPARTVGVKYFGNQSSPSDCYRTLTERLRALR